MASFDSYVIFTTPRSGSTLLCKLLARTAVAGNPASYFHRPSIDAWCDDRCLTWDATLSEREVLNMVFRATIAEGSLETGMFGLRLQRRSFNFFRRKLTFLHAGFLSDVQRFRAAFGPTSFIHLTRRNKIEQAVSLVKAEQTGLWHMAPDGTELERLAAPSKLAYDADRIKAHFDELTIHDRDWERWFEAEDIEPLRLTYETLSRDPIETLRGMLDHLGLDRNAADGVHPEVSKLADDTSRAWAARFRSEQNAA